MHRDVRPDDPPTTWCGTCGYGRNPYRHSTCPACYVDDGDGYWLGCDRCGFDWLTEQPPTEQSCPRCGAAPSAVAEVRTRGGG